MFLSTNFNNTFIRRACFFFLHLCECIPDSQGPHYEAGFGRHSSCFILLCSGCVAFSLFYVFNLFVFLPLYYFIFLCKISCYTASSYPRLWLVRYCQHHPFQLKVQRRPWVNFRESIISFTWLLIASVSISEQVA